MEIAFHRIMVNPPPMIDTEECSSPGESVALLCCERIVYFEIIVRWKIDQACKWCNDRDILSRRNSQWIQRLKDCLALSS